MTEDANFDSDFLLEKSQKKAKIEKSCSEEPETDDMIVDDEGGAVKSNEKLTHSGSIISFVLDDTVDVDSRVSNYSKSMGTLRFIWNNNNVTLITKVKLHNATLNLISRGGENWSGNAANVSKCEVLYHNSMRRILKISMTRVKDERTRNKTIRKYFLNESSIEDTRRRRH